MTAPIIIIPLVVVKNAGTYSSGSGADVIEGTNVVVSIFAR